MTSMMYAVKLSTGVELLDCVLDASAHRKNDHLHLLRSVFSFHKKPQCACIIRKVISGTCFVSINISNNSIKHYYL